MINTEHLDTRININSTHTYKSSKSSFKIGNWNINGFILARREHTMIFICLINDNEINMFGEVMVG